MDEATGAFLRAGCACRSGPLWISCNAFIKQQSVAAQRAPTSMPFQLRSVTSLHSRMNSPLRGVERQIQRGL